MPALRTQAVICTLEEYKAPDFIIVIVPPGSEADDPGREVNGACTST